MWRPGWESLREHGYVYVLLIPFSVHLELLQHCSSAILQYKTKSQKRKQANNKKTHILPLHVLLHVNLQGVSPCRQGRLKKSPPVILSEQRQMKTIHLGLVYSWFFSLNFTFSFTIPQEKKTSFILGYEYFWMICTQIFVYGMEIY